MDGEYYCNGCSWQCCGEECECGTRETEEGQDVSAVGAVREAAHAGSDREGGGTAAATGSDSDQRRETADVTGD